MSPKLQDLLTDLRSILTCSYRFFTDQLYPARLLPQQKFRIKLLFDEIVNGCDVLLIRRTTFKPEEAFNELGNLKTGVISIKDFPNLSMNMTGGNFQFSDVRFKLKMHTSATCYWQGQAVKLKDHLNEYEVLQNQYSILFRTKDLHNQQIPFRAKGKDAAKLIKSLNLPVIQDADEAYTRFGTAKVSHEPLNLNYWHVELQILEETQNPISKVKNQWESSAVNYLLEHVMSKYAIPLTDQTFKRLDKKHYMV